MTAGANQAIGWVLALFVLGIVLGSSVYTLTEYKNALNDSVFQAKIDSIIGIYDIVPTWVKILLIMGFSTVIAFLAIAVYKRLQVQTGGF